MDNPFESLFGGLSGNPLSNLFAKYLQSKNQEPKYEALAPLSTKDNKEWEKLISDFEKYRSKILEIEARKKIFWTKLERKLGIYDRSLKIEAGMVMGEVEERHNCQTPGERLSLPGFCDGDCDNCSQKPEDEDS